MDTIEYYTQDKTQWGRGDWESEPDKKQWLDQATGYPCLIVRGPLGALCGYVGVSKDHPHFGKDYEVPNVEVHGGLTFAGACQPNADEARHICHKVDGEDHVWWFGFDCAHYRDYVPGMRSIRREAEMVDPFGGFERYRNLAYVTGEVESLAQQLKSLAVAA
ncbi:hypothetical protein [Tautonia marina]|uniref:hypothetical protein n=1 Tax=Tautonia marina TaxID=2653855 RepID=UPI00191C4AAE|nr:hypothetical protein [Tautonia marina]